MKSAPILVLLIALGCRPSGQDSAVSHPVRVRCANVEAREWADLSILRGTVAAAPDRDAIVSAQVPGRLLRVLCREGDVVDRGALLAEVESRPIQDMLRQAEALLAQARAAREAASSLATREAHLFERGISARQSFEVAQSSLAQTEAAVASATAQVDLARQNLERCSVRAPMAGVVVRLLRRTGEVVDGTPATPIAEVADPTSLEFNASAPARDIVLLATGQSASIVFDALSGRRFAATVRAVSPAVDTATGVGSVRLLIRPGDVRPPLGLLGLAEVTTGKPRRVLAVPASAVRNAGGARTEVVTCDQGHARPRVVEIGLRREGFVEVSRGLEPGLRVALDELMGLEEGTPINESTP